MSGDALPLLALAVIAAVKVAQVRIHTRQLATQIRELRHAATTPLAFEPIGARWQDLVAGLEVPPGMVALGDFLEILAGRGASGAVRTFADQGGTLFGWLTKAGPQRVRVMLLFSATESDFYLTRVVPRRAGSVASPPFLHREDIPATRTVAGAIAQHRERVASAKGLVRVTSSAELHEQLQRMRNLTIAWRESQAPAALLEQDLRAILGVRYREYGARVAKKLATELPVARVLS